MRGKLIGIVAMAGLAGLVATVTVRRVPEGGLMLARGPGSSRVLPPGLHLVNPFAENLEVIPVDGLSLRGSAEFQGRDGIPVRLPFTAEAALSPHEFVTALGPPHGVEPAEAVARAVEGALATWGSGMDSVRVLDREHRLEPLPVVADVCRRLGIRLRSLTLHDPDPLVYIHLADAILAGGGSPRARAVVDAAAETRPDDWRLLTARGLLAEADGAWDRAEPLYRAATRRAPGALEALDRLRARYHDDGRAAELEPLLLDALAARPDSIRLRNWLALTYAALERYPDAMHQLQSALELDPASETTLENLAGLYKMFGHGDEAAAAYRRALEGNPGSGRLWFKLGLAEISRGDVEAARTALEEARARGPASVDLHNWLAEAYAQSGMVAEATAELLASYRLDPAQEGLAGELTRRLGHSPDAAADAP